jgi:hypothetical protein
MPYVDQTRYFYGRRLKIVLTVIFLTELKDTKTVIKIKLYFTKLNTHYVKFKQAKKMLIILFVETV